MKKSPHNMRLTASFIWDSSIFIPSSLESSLSLYSFKEFTVCYYFLSYQFASFDIFIHVDNYPLSLHILASTNICFYMEEEDSWPWRFYLSWIIPMKTLSAIVMLWVFLISAFILSQLPFTTFWAEKLPYFHNKRSSEIVL